MKISKDLTARRVTLPRRALTSAEFSELADVPPETEWFANIENPHTRRAYRNDLKEFMTFTGIRTPIELRLITRAHVIAWRKDLDPRKLAAGSVRRKLSALSSLYEFLTDHNAVPVNPVKGVKRPKVDTFVQRCTANGQDARRLRDLESQVREWLNCRGHARLQLDTNGLVKAWIARYVDNGWRLVLQPAPA